MVARVLFLWLPCWGNTTTPLRLSPRHFSHRPTRLMPTRDTTTSQPAPQAPPPSVSPGWDGGEWASPNVVMSLVGIMPKVGMVESIARPLYCPFPFPFPFPSPDVGVIVGVVVGGVPSWLV